MTSEVIDLGKSIFASIVGGFLVYWLIKIFTGKKPPYRWIIIAAVASIVIAFILITLHQPWYWIVIGVAFIVVVPSLVRANRSHVESLQKEWDLEESRLKKAIDSLKAKLEKANKILDDAGVSRVWTREELPIEKCYDDIDDSYRWLGFSAIKEIHDIDVRKRIRSCSKVLHLEYIILDSVNELAVLHQAKVKNEETDEVRDQLERTASSVETLRKRLQKIDLSLLKHSLFPTFRVTLVDDRKIFVGAYEPVPGENKYKELSGGSFSDFIELKESEGKNLLFKWFTLYYERERLHAEKQALERFVVKERFSSPHMSMDNLIQRASGNGLTYMDKLVTHDVLQSIMREFGITEKGPTICPINENVSGGCPLGIERIVPTAKDTLESIFDTKEEYHFVGIGSENIFRRMEDSGQLSDFRENVEPQKKNPIKFHFVVRDNENYDLMQQQDEWRKPERPVNEQVTGAIREHNRYRKYGWDLKTYKSDTLANFRVVVVDDAAYVSFNEPCTSSQLVHQLIIRENDNPYNLYNWFRKYVELAEKDVEWKNEHRLMAPSIIEPTCHDPVYSKNDCPFCRISDEKSVEKYDKILFRRKNFLVIPAKGHFCPGYLLVIPKKHIYSFASITESALKEELFELMKNIREKLKDKFEEPIIFEHGSKFGGGYSGNTIDHAHLHFVPCNLDLSKALIDDYRGTKRITELTELQSMNRPYLFIEDQYGKKYAAEVERKMKSQYLRRLLYGLMYPNADDNGWDWRTHNHETFLEQTLSKFP